MKGKVVHVLTQTLCHEDIWGSGGIAPPLFTSALDTERNKNYRLFPKCNKQQQNSITQNIQEKTRNIFNDNIYNIYNFNLFYRYDCCTEIFSN
jgi:hypothetical protein